MAGELSAGAVLVELKAQYQDLKKNVAAAKGEMTGFGASVDATAKRVSTSGQQISGSFDAMEKRSLRTLTALARFSAVMFAAQNVAEQFAGTDKNQGLKAAATGLTTFSAIAASIPHPVGIALGAIAGLATGFASYAKNAAEANIATEAVLKGIEKFNARRLAFQSALVGANLTSTPRDLGAAQLGAEIERLETKLKDEITNALEIHGRLGTLDEKPGDTSEGLKRVQDDALKTSKLLFAKRRDLARAEAIKDRELLAQENKRLVEGAQIELQAGLISPLEALQVEARAARRELDELLQSADRDPTALGLALDKAKRTQGRLDAQKNLDSLARGFGESVSSALGNAILSAKKPSEALADVWQSLFSNAVNEGMKQAQAGLSSLFKSISGGSDVIGGALTAALGIAGGILSNRKNKSSESFTPVQSIVESSQATRGIVAGPSSISVATVSEDISRSVAPLVALNRLMAQLLNRIEKNTRGEGGPAAAGGSDVVAVPTA